MTLAAAAQARTLSQRLSEPAGMDNLTLALTMKPLAIWLDRAWQPAGFVSKQYDGAPFGRCYVSIDPSRQAQYASANRNRVHLCGAEPGLRPEGLARLIEQFTAAGVTRFFVWLSPGPDMDTARGWLAQAGFKSHMRWTQYPTLVRESLETPSFRTDLVVREARASDLAAAHAAVGEMMWGEYERSFGKDGFAHFVAFDGTRPVAIAALAVFESLGYLTLATTADGDRKRGAAVGADRGARCQGARAWLYGSRDRDADDARALVAQS